MKPTLRDRLIMFSGLLYHFLGAVYTSDIDCIFVAKNENEIGYDENTGRELIFIDPKYYRPTEVFQLCGDATKAKTILGWEPKITFTELVEEMVENDCLK